ncbi:MAG: molybdopterin-dependent oxidoreductase [Chloroflexi bacterium]|nr:molybdopterin-dependent oxidoreductase [Chloroflexota bacterium]
MSAKSDGWFGRPVRRVEDGQLLRGRGRFVGDIERPGQLHAAFVRSPHAHARIKGIETSAALALPGVAAVLTFADLGAAARPMPPFLAKTAPKALVEFLKPEVKADDSFLLPPDKVRYAGEAVAMVIAESRYLAEDAAELVEVDYEPLPAVADVEAALQPDAPLLHEAWGDNVCVRFTVQKGDVDQAFQRADHVVRERFYVHRYTGITIETRGAVAEYDPERRELMVWSATQNAHPLRQGIAHLLGLPQFTVRVIAPDVGGGYGIKAILYPEDVLVALAALRLGRPVKWIEDRLEHLRSAIHAREQIHDIELALDADGRILGMRDRFLIDNGPYNHLGLAMPHNTVAHLMGPYRVPALWVEARCVVTNKVPAAPYRGAGRPEAVFAVDRVIDCAARQLGMDPAELRLRNSVRPDEMPYDAGLLYRDGQPLVYDSGDYPETMRRALALVDYERLRAQQAELRAQGRYLGVGTSSYVEGTGVGPFEGAVVRVDGSGKVVVYTGACSQGQGHQTVFAQICADHLGVDLADVTIVGGDTAGLTHGYGTIASRSGVTAGNAVAAAAGEVRARALKMAAQLLEAHPDDLEIRNGQVQVVGLPGRKVSLGEVAQALEPGRPRPADLQPGLEATVYYEPPTVTYTNGAHAVVVEVDVETGQVRTLKYAIAHDCGRMINPMIVEGQVHGGVAQGIGGGLFEELVYDGEGQLLTASLMDYLVPTAAEIPHFEVAHLESPSPRNPLGIKGLGEGGAISPPAAYANAVEDALAPFGVKITRGPLSPTRVRDLIAAARRQ